MAVKLVLHHFWQLSHGLLFDRSFPEQFSSVSTLGY